MGSGQNCCVEGRVCLRMPSAEKANREFDQTQTHSTQKGKASSNTSKLILLKVKWFGPSEHVISTRGQHCSSGSGDDSSAGFRIFQLQAQPEFITPQDKHREPSFPGAFSGTALGTKCSFNSSSDNSSSSSCSGQG